MVAGVVATQVGGLLSCGGPSRVNQADVVCSGARVSAFLENIKYCFKRAERLREGFKKKKVGKFQHWVGGWVQTRNHHQKLT